MAVSMPECGGEWQAEHKLPGTVSANRANFIVSYQHSYDSVILTMVLIHHKAMDNKTKLKLCNKGNHQVTHIKV